VDDWLPLGPCDPLGVDREEESVDGLAAAFGSDFFPPGESVDPVGLASDFFSAWESLLAAVSAVAAVELAFSRLSLR